MEAKQKDFRVVAEIMSQSMELPTQNSVNTFQEVRKVMRLPHISYVYMKSSKVISSRNQRAFLLCIQKIQVEILRAENENSTENSRTAVTALDSAGVSSSVQGNYRLQKMVGQCKGHKFQPMTNKFSMMVDQLKVTAAVNNLNATDQGEVSLDVTNDIST